MYFECFICLFLILSSPMVKGSGESSLDTATASGERYGLYNNTVIYLVIALGIFLCAAIQTGDLLFALVISIVGGIFIWLAGLLRYQVLYYFGAPRDSDSIMREYMASFGEFLSRPFKSEKPTLEKAPVVYVYPSIQAVNSGLIAPTNYYQYTFIDYFAGFIGCASILTVIGTLIIRVIAANPPYNGQFWMNAFIFSFVISTLFMLAITLSRSIWWWYDPYVYF